MKIQNTRGFTLIELMIVIAIVAILVALAVPAYQDYTVRAKVAECISNSTVPKLAISEYFQANGVYPADEDIAASTQPAGSSNFCTGFDYPDDDGTAGWFYVLVDENAINSSSPPGKIEPKLDPTTNISGVITWRCTVGQTAEGSVKYLPATCRNPELGPN